jgi:hypothetical protein
MKLTPLNGFSNIEPVRKMILLSLIAFVPIALLPLFQIGAEFYLPTQALTLEKWLIPWFIVTFALALLIIGIGDRSIFIFGIVFVIILSILGFNTQISNNIISERILQIVFGLFWTFLLAYQLYRAFAPLQKVLIEKKNSFVHVLDLRLVELTEKAGGSLSDKSNPSEDVMVTIERTLKIRGVALKARTSIISLSSVLSIFSPVLSSFAFPILLGLITNLISSLILPIR